MSLLRSFATVSGYTALSRVLGFLRDILIANYLGSGPIADAFFVAFVPISAKRLEEGGRKAPPPYPS